MTLKRRREKGPSVPAPILVVAGLAREADRVRGEGVETLLSGANADLLRAALEAKAANEYAAVVSFGLCGGLDPALRPGDAILGTQAIGAGQAFEAHPKLRRVLREGFAGAGLRLREGPVAGVEQPAMTVAAKADLRGGTRAIAVDMESHVAGAFAAQRGLPFAILRVVCDPAGRALPPLAAAAVKPDGGVDVALVLRAILREPAQLGGLIRAGLDSGAAFATLGRCGRLLGPLLGLVLAQLR